MKKIIIASGPVIVEDKKVLLNQHGENNFWKFCGGQVEHFNKNLKENAQIKAKEEMGMEVEFLEEEPFITYTSINKGKEKIDVILVHFLGKRSSNIKPNPEIEKWDWIDLRKLPKNLAPNIIPVLKHYKFLR